MLDSLGQLHAAIVNGLRQKIPETITVGAYPEIERSLKLPAVLVELSEIDPGEDPGTGETALIAHFQARAIFDPAQKNAELLVRELAAQIAVAITHETWGVPVSVAQMLQIGEDAFKPELDGYLSWMVEWTHQFNIGPQNWPWPDSTGLCILLGIYPETGAGKEDKYWQLGDAVPENWGES
ncbi:MAG: hypothetical protein FWD77_01625 [Betaproteobacteria bacterium]|nr:hypothetical protein [Betaproteobacteria bacterium]